MRFLDNFRLMPDGEFAHSRNAVQGFAVGPDQLIFLPLETNPAWLRDVIIVESFNRWLPQYICGPCTTKNLLDRVQKLGYKLH